MFVVSVPIAEAPLARRMGRVIVLKIDVDVGGWLSTIQFSVEHNCWCCVHSGCTAFIASESNAIAVLRRVNRKIGACFE